MKRERLVHKYSGMVCGFLVMTLCGITYLPDNKGRRSSSDKYDITCKKCLKKLNDQ